MRGEAKAVARAAEFVLREGTEAERARLAHLAQGAVPTPALVSQLLAGQRPDGGFAPFWARDYSGVDATCFRIAQAEQAGLDPAGPELESAISFLACRQRPDGSFEEEAAQAAVAPRWAVPGDEAAMRYLTANAGYWLARAGRRPAAEAAATFLLADRDPSGGLATFLHGQWLAAALFWRLGQRSEAEHLLAGVASGLEGLAAGSLAWLIASLRGAAVPQSHPVIFGAAELLLRLQREDGAFPSEDGPPFDVHATLEAIRALR